MSIAVRDEGKKVNSNINVTPMVDVMLVLLIIFMVITPMLVKGIDVTLPKANNPVLMPDADRDDAIIVAVNRDGKIFLDTAQVLPEALTGKIKELLDNRKKNAPKMVFVRADARAKYKAVVDVVDNVRSAGVDELGLLTERKSSTNLMAQ
jgi:biopolymer transport protein TolR